MPRLSVHMAAWNTRSYIGTAVRSTLAALTADAELVVLDDGSDDGTAEVLDRFGDRRVRRLEVRPNAGYALARRRLLEESDSELVAIMDSDDVCLPWRFRHQLAALRRGVDLVVSPAVGFRTGPFRARPGLPVAISAEAAPLHLTFGCPFTHSTLLARRPVYDALDGYRVVRAEDYDLYVRAVLAGFRLCRTGLPVVGYRERPGQASNSVEYDAAASRDDEVRDVVAQLRRSVLGSLGTAGADLGDASAAALRAGLSTAIEVRGIRGVQRRVLERHARVKLGAAAG